MALIDQGLFFLDHKATKDFKEKGKYIITLSTGVDEDDKLLCFSLNTEHRMDIYIIGCNKMKAKFIISPDMYKFSFLKSFSCFMLNEPMTYTVKELYDSHHIEVLEKDKADIKLLREIKNCIDTGYLTPGYIKLLNEAFPK